ncbi:twinkle mtDNA helicase-like [Schistocerca gregaria]|uniref:twinkle mtDNA helicase-like n=1 Tax=Schistocerca gregaria TaxID=7010 RepID=UPI00211F4619|nr:twinkle mtDNA helicase-like [Schistocerca gregaria]
MRKNLVFKRNEKNQIMLKECPFCHDTKSKPTNLWKLYIYTDNGRYFCFRCDAQGSWFDFQKRLGDPYSISHSKNHGHKLTATNQHPQLNLMSNQPKTLDQDKLAKYISNLEKLPQAIDYLKNVRKLDARVYQAYKIGSCVLRTYKSLKDPDEANTLSDRTEDHICITFPWIEYNAAGKEVFHRVKIRSITEKSLQRLEPAGGRWGWFGMHLVPEDAKSIIITEGEFDAMAVYQATGLPAISLPAGANCLPIELLEQLERFEKIWIWMDDDVVGQQGAQKCAKKLGVERCSIVQTRLGLKDGPKDANDALRQGLDLKILLSQAKPLPHKEIVSFSELREQVYREIANPDQVAGIKSTSFPNLSKLLKGHRKGELTIFSGPTGIGKTTLLAQLSLDYVMQGIPTLWGSFELHNVRLAKKLLNQFAKKSLEKNIQEFELIADKFQELPIYFMRFHGSTELDQVLDAMEYALYVYDVEHVVIDNLQFMTPMVTGRGFDKFEQLDFAISKLRNFSTSKNVHISLIIHPRKEDSGHALSTNSVFGSAKATQEADNVIMIQHGKFYRYLEVTKNRFSGDLGKVAYKYNSSENTFVEMTAEEIQEAEKRDNRPTASLWKSAISN